MALLESDFDAYAAVLAQLQWSLPEGGHNIDEPSGRELEFGTLDPLNPLFVENAAESKVFQSGTDEELLVGALLTTVEELIVTAPADMNGYGIIYLDYPSGSGMDPGNFAGQVMSDAFAFGQLNVSNPSGSTVGAIADQALTSLYLLSKGAPETLDGPYSSTLTPADIAAKLPLLGNIQIRPITENSENAYTQFYHDGSANIIIDPNRMAGYISAFGPQAGLLYVVYHELGHFLGGPGSAENVANEWGQVVSERFGGTLYPTDAQMDAVWGPGSSAPR